MRAGEVATLDAAWLRGHPLPVHGEDTDKNSRGRLLLVGGSMLVPGGLTLTAEAAFRAGAGKVQLALPDMLAVPTGMALPEAGIIALPAGEDGEIASVEALRDPDQSCGLLVIGPAMASPDAAGLAIDALLGDGPGEYGPDAVVLDAAAINAAATRADMLRGLGGKLILTPHAGEMAALLGCDLAAVEADPQATLLKAAESFDAVVLLKGSTTLIAGPEGALLHYGGGGVGLATGGSGDVLTGIVAGLAARGLPPFEAAAWGVWLHGEAGRRLAERMGPIGFLARELPAEVPGLMRGV